MLGYKLYRNENPIYPFFGCIGYQLFSAKINIHDFFATDGKAALLNGLCRQPHHKAAKSQKVDLSNTTALDVKSLIFSSSEQVPIEHHNRGLEKAHTQLSSSKVEKKFYDQGWAKYAEKSSKKKGLSKEYPVENDGGYEGLFSFILMILSIALVFLATGAGFYFALLLGLVSLVLGIIGMVKKNSKTDLTFAQIVVGLNVISALLLVMIILTQI